MKAISMGELLHMKIIILEYNQRDYVNYVISKSCFQEDDFIFFSYRINTEYELIEKISQCKYDAIIVAISENRYLERVLFKFLNTNITNIFVIRLLCLDKQYNFLDKFHKDSKGNICYNKELIDKITDTSAYLVHLETHVVDHCNLNCKSCNNFAPFVEKPTYADVVFFERDIKRISSQFSQIGRFFLLGGEPLLAPELCCDMITTYRRYYPEGELRLLTNAILIPNMKESFWDIVIANKVIIHISLYPPVKQQFEKIKSILINHGIEYVVFKEVKTFLKHWTCYPFEDEGYNNDRCGSAGCHFLREGKIYKCPDAFLIRNISDRTLWCVADEIDIYEEDNRKILNRVIMPADLCKKCTYKRSQVVKWEMVEGKAANSDWLIKNRYEAENEELKQKVQSQEKELQKGNREVERLNKEKYEMELKISSIQTENINLKSILKKADEDNSQLRASFEKQAKENSILNEVLAKKDKTIQSNELQLKKTSNEYKRVSNSLSYKLGLLFTWIPRRAYKIMSVVHDTAIKRRIKSGDCQFIRIYKVFKDDVLHGYDVYKKIIRQFGVNVKILYTVPLGTGDYYLCGLFLRDYLRSNNITNYIFVIPEKGGERRASELFEVYKGHEYFYPNLSFGKDFYSGGLLGTDIFYRDGKRTLIQYLHHRPATNKWPSFRLTADKLQGYKGLNMVDCYLWFGFDYGDTVPLRDHAVFNSHEYVYEKYFYKTGLVVGKTILLSPYSTGLKKYELPKDFWVLLVNYFKEKGYICVTNCFGNEEPITGSSGVAIPYSDSVPFTDLCGTYIGIRSGLCDIISSSKCKKIIIHTYEAKYWPNGNSISYTGLNDMGICEDAIELEYRVEDGFNKIIERINKEIN